MEPVLGIDLGTTNSVVAAVEGGSPHVIPNRSGYKLTPSVVAIAQNGRQLVGQMARRQSVTNPRNTIYAAKRLIGRKFSSKEVQRVRELVPYEVVAGEHDDTRIQLGQAYSVPEISAMVLAEIKRDAEAHFGQTVTKAVITVPAYFNDAQRQATKDAGRIAGLDVLRIINEPTSAALAYLAGRPGDTLGKLVVFDLGGGTFDVSILEVSSGVYRVVATGGDTFLGGEDFDQRIVEWLVFGFAKEHQIDLRKDRMAMQRLKEAAEKAKCDLSDAQESQINLPFIFSPASGAEGTPEAAQQRPAVHLMRSLSRSKLEELTRDLVERALMITERTLGEAGLTPSKISDVLLVGGQTRMPKVQDGVRALFGHEPLRGAHPDEVVALGAGIQAQALVAETSKMLLLDVTPLSLGITVAGGYSAILIPKNTTVPTSATHIFTTVRDYQTSVKIMVLQGEGQRAEDNELLGEFLLSGLRSAPRGEVDIDVTFAISADGIVSVQAKDRETGTEASITVTASSGLTPEELQRIIDEQRDQLLEQRQAAETRTKADELRAAMAELEKIFPQVRSLIDQSEFGPDALTKAERTLQRGKAAAEGNDLTGILSAAEAVESILALFRGIVAKLAGTQT
jgi:molecular chaperone DnaK